MKIIAKYSATLFAAVFCLSASIQAAVFSTNFDDPSLTAGIYANNAAVNTGNLNLTVMNSVGAASGYTVQVATSSITSKKVIQYIDNTTTQLVGGVRADVSSMVAASNGYLSGSCSFAELAVSGSRGSFVLALSNATYTSSTNSAFQITFYTTGGNIVMDYFNGTSSTTAKNGGTNINFSTGTSYSIQWWADFTNAIQDTYGFSVYDASSNLVFTSGTLSTRAANISTTSLYLMAFAGNELTIQGADPFVEIQSLSVTTIPEPHTWAMILSGIAMLAMAYRKKWSFDFVE